MTTLIETWLQSQQVRGFSAKTLARRRSVFNRLGQITAPRSPVEATSAEIERLLASLPSVRSRYGYLSDLKLFFGWCVRRGLVETDPTVMIDPPRLPRAVPRPLPRWAVDDVLAAPDQMTRRAVALGIFAGLRRGEISRLDWQQVDLMAGVLTVVQSKGKRDRVIPIHPRLAVELAPALRAGPVIVGPAGHGLCPESIGLMLRAWFDSLGMRNVVPHQLRHTFGTEAARSANGDLVIVGELMGHSSPQTTAGYVLADATRTRPTVGGMWTAA